MIRDANVADLFALVQYGEYFWKQTPYCSKIPYNPQAVRDLLTWMIEDQYLYLFEHGRTIAGFLGLIEVPLMFNPEFNLATEVFFFVNPKYRGQGISKELYAYAEEDIQTDIISFGDMSTSTDMDTYYKAQGFSLTERTYTKVR